MLTKLAVAVNFTVDSSKGQRPIRHRTDSAAGK